jgi:hypothetical protein
VAIATARAGNVIGGGDWSEDQQFLKIETAVEWTLNWYRAYSEASNMLDLTIEQLESYERLRSQEQSGDCC